MDTLNEGAELIAESGKTYLAVSPLGQANVWTAVDKADHDHIVVLKAPSTDDTGTSWPRFQHEMVMHELFKESSSIRKQVDRIAPVKGAGSAPVLVLEIFQATLWHARTKRPFAKAEIKAIARDILQGLQEVHAKGLVYVDLKMQNVMLDGFDANTPGNGVPLITKLGDLGIVMEPASGKAQPVAYRAPEVFFRGVISQAADIWAFGLIYCHLLEAQGRFSKTGLYDDLFTGSGSMFEREQAMRTALANDYDLENVEYYKDCALPVRDPSHPTGKQWEELRKRGLDDEDVEFLQWVLKADPRERPSSQAILDSRWMQDDSDPQQPPVETATEVQKDHQQVDTTPSVTADTPENAALQAQPSEPAFDPEGSAAFDTLMRTQTEEGRRSPIKEHPLVTDALSSAREEEADASTAQDENIRAAPVVDREVPNALNEREGQGSRPAAAVGGTSGTYLSYR